MPDTRPRRRPRRRSGREIVEAILDAACDLIADRGPRRMTTNAIAERAGVSVGSVYQYFPNKEAIVAGVTARLNRRLLEELRRAAEAEGTARERLERLVDALASTRIGGYELRRALLEEVPRSWDATFIEGVEEAVRPLLEELCAELAPGLDPAELRRRQLLATFAIRGAVQGALLYQPELLHREQTRALLARLALAIFDAPEAPA